MIKDFLIKIKFIKVISSCCVAWGTIPKYYGIAWSEDMGYVRFFCPIPFNIFISLAVNFFWWAACFGNKSYRNKIEKIGYDKGYIDGRLHASN